MMGMLSSSMVPGPSLTCMKQQEENLRIFHMRVARYAQHAAGQVTWRTQCMEYNYKGAGNDFALVLAPPTITGTATKVSVNVIALKFPRGD